MSEQRSPLAARLIRKGALEIDTWRLFSPTNDAGPTRPADEPGWIVPLSLWSTQHEALRQRRHPVAVQLEPDADLQTLLAASGELASAPLTFIAIDFPVYTDGRGYSLAQLLRTRYAYRGELRAVGDVMIDTIHYQARVGFDSFLVKAGHDPEQAMAAFKAFTVHYQQTYPAPG